MNATKKIDMNKSVSCSKNAPRQYIPLLTSAFSFSTFEIYSGTVQLRPHISNLLTSLFSVSKWSSSLSTFYWRLHVEVAATHTASKGHLDFGFVFEFSDFCDISIFLPIYPLDSTAHSCTLCNVTVSQQFNTVGWMKVLNSACKIFLLLKGIWLQPLSSSTRQPQDFGVSCDDRREFNKLSHSRRFLFWSTRRWWWQLILYW